MRPLPLAVLGMSLMTNVVVAQSGGNGSVAGRVVFCKMAELPVGDLGAADQTPSAPDLADVTPGLRRFAPSPDLVLPGADLEVKIAGTQLSARTDADGRFALGGLPANQPLTLQVILPADAARTLELPNLFVGAGETLDLGMLGVSGCAEATTTTTTGDQPVLIPRNRLVPPRNDDGAASVDEAPPPK